LFLLQGNGTVKSSTWFPPTPVVKEVDEKPEEPEEAMVAPADIKPPSNPLKDLIESIHGNTVFTAEELKSRIDSINEDTLRNSHTDCYTLKVILDSLLKDRTKTVETGDTGNKMMEEDDEDDELPDLQQLPFKTQSIRVESESKKFSKTNNPSKIKSSSKNLRKQNLFKKSSETNSAGLSAGKNSDQTKSPEKSHQNESKTIKDKPMLKKHKKCSGELTNKTKVISGNTETITNTEREQNSNNMNQEQETQLSKMSEKTLGQPEKEIVKSTEPADLNKTSISESSTGKDDSNKKNEFTSPDREAKKHVMEELENQSEAMVIKSNNQAPPDYVKRISPNHEIILVRFHGKTITKLISPSGNFFILVELLRRCFRITGANKKRQVDGIRRKQKQLNIPEIVMEEVFYQHAVIFLTNRHVIKTVPPNFFVIKESDALRLFHHIFNDQYCSPGCITRFVNKQTSDAAKSQMPPVLSKAERKVRKQEPIAGPSKQVDEVIDLCDGNSDVDDSNTMPYVDGSPHERLQELEPDLAAIGKTGDTTRASEQPAAGDAGEMDEEITDTIGSTSEAALVQSEKMVLSNERVNSTGSQFMELKAGLCTAKSSKKAGDTVIELSPETTDKPEDIDVLITGKQVMELAPEVTTEHDIGTDLDMDCEKEIKTHGKEAETQEYLTCNSLFPPKETESSETVTDMESTQQEEGLEQVHVEVEDVEGLSATDLVIQDVRSCAEENMTETENDNIVEITDDDDDVEMKTMTNDQIKGDAVGIEIVTIDSVESLLALNEEDKENEIEFISSADEMILLDSSLDSEDADIAFRETADKQGVPVGATSCQLEKTMHNKTSTESQAKCLNNAEVSVDCLDEPTTKAAHSGRSMSLDATQEEKDCPQSRNRSKSLFEMFSNEQLNSTHISQSNSKNSKHEMRSRRFSMLDGRSSHPFNKEHTLVSSDKERHNSCPSRKQHSSDKENVAEFIATRIEPEVIDCDSPAECEMEAGNIGAQTDTEDDVVICRVHCTASEPESDQFMDLGMDEEVRGMEDTQDGRECARRAHRLVDNILSTAHGASHDELKLAYGKLMLP